jgi:hypothetical protein
VIAHLRKGETYADLAPGSGLPRRATALAKAVQVLVLAD